MLKIMRRKILGVVFSFLIISVVACNNMIAKADEGMTDDSVDIELEFDTETFDNQNYYLYAYASVDLTDDEYEEIEGYEGANQLLLEYNMTCQMGNGYFILVITCTDDQDYSESDTLCGYLFDNGDMLLISSDFETVFLQNDEESTVGFFSDIFRSIANVIHNTTRFVRYIDDSIQAIGKRALNQVYSHMYVPVVDQSLALINYQHNLSQCFPVGYSDNYSGDFINNQSVFTNWQIGAKTISEVGCGPIALYNALLSRGMISSSQTVSEFSSLIRTIELQSGVVLCGTLGISPRAISTTLLLDGCYVNSFTSQNLFLNALNSASNDSDFICLVVINRYSIFSGMHYYHVSKKNNCYYVYNNGKMTSCSVNDVIDSNSVLMVGYQVS